MTWRQLWESLGQPWHNWEITWRQLWGSLGQPWDILKRNLGQTWNIFETTVVSMWLFMDLDPLIALKRKKKQNDASKNINRWSCPRNSVPEYSQYNGAHRRLILKAEEANIFSCGFWWRNSPESSLWDRGISHRRTMWPRSRAMPRLSVATARCHRRSDGSQIGL